ncbi:MAG: hypothetical protein ACOYOS_02785 [Syntrophales bacterium]
MTTFDELVSCDDLVKSRKLVSAKAGIAINRHSGESRNPDISRRCKDTGYRFSPV